MQDGQSWGRSLAKTPGLARQRWVCSNLSAQRLHTALVSLLPHLPRSEHPIVPRGNRYAEATKRSRDVPCAESNGRPSW